MNEAEIKKQLKALRGVKPRPDWKAKTREILLSQISGASELRDVGRTELFFAYSRWQIKSLFSQPAAVVITVMLAVFLSGTMGIYAARDTAPGDSLYIAKIISEKTQLALTFGDEAKVKLGLEFAGNRAKELGQVLSKPDAQPEKEALVEELTVNFKKEIDAVKNRLGKMAAVSEPARPPVPASDMGTGLQPAAPGTTTEMAAAENASVYSANLGREDKGLQLSSGTAPADEPSAPAAEPLAAETETATAAPAAETETATAAPESLAGEPAAPASDPALILEEAEKLFIERDYTGTISKLEEANAMLSDEQGEVKGETETVVPAATGTPAVGDAAGGEKGAGAENEAAGATTTPAPEPEG